MGIKVNNNGKTTSAKGAKGSSLQRGNSRALDTTPQDIDKAWQAAEAIGARNPMANANQEPTPECPPTREDRVRAIMELMPARWVRGKTGEELATRWGLSANALRDLAAEAWRRVRAQDPSYVRDKLSSALEESVEAVRLADEPATAKAKALAVVTGAWAPLVGANAAAKVEVVGAAPPGLPLEVAEAWGKTDDLSRRKVHRHVLLEALASLDEWPYTERVSALQDVRDLLTRLEGSIVAVAGGGER
jgi:hypothetical protein